ncbi:unnamed protein product [Effrenium voratum]|uniref:BTB domain-containing protein n=1 Tax=Effrenium voratum TaxID=2562239 RepID=A0AA36NEZ5_9DINO|nr:unnamed protein product [Effrenium voratum]
METKRQAPSPHPKRPRVSFTTVSMRTFGESQSGKGLTEDKTLMEDSVEVTANVESLSRLVLEDEMDAHARNQNGAGDKGRVVLKQGTPTRTPMATEETSPLPENWDLYKQFKSSQEARMRSPELASSSRRLSPGQRLSPRGFLAAASLKAPPLPKANRQKSPDTVDMSGVMRSIQMGPSREDDQDTSEVPEGRKSFATFHGSEPGPEIYAVKQASRRLQEPLNRGRALQRHQHHRSDLNSSAERFREMQQQVIKDAEEDQRLMDQKATEAQRAMQEEQGSLKSLEEQVAQAREAVQTSKEELRQAKKRLLRQKAQRVELEQVHLGRTLLVTRARENFVELRFRNACATVKARLQNWGHLSGIHVKAHVTSPALWHPAMPRVGVSVEELELTVASPWCFTKGDKLYSPAAGPRGGFQCRLLVFPAGSPAADQTLSAFVEVSAPEQMREWTCEDVFFTIKVISSKSKKSIHKQETFSFTPSCNDRGWHNMVEFSQLTTASGLIDAHSKVHLVAYVSNLPLETEPRVHVPEVDFSLELKSAELLVHDGPPLFFDQRILVARSEYFRKMFTADYLESSTGVVDLRKDPQASHQCVAAILRFLFTNALDPNMDLELGLALRAMADKFCLQDLKEAAQGTLKKMVSEENLLQVLAQVFETGCELEASCWQLLSEDPDILWRQELQLDALVPQNPALAKKLILFGRRKVQKTAA